MDRETTAPKRRNYVKASKGFSDLGTFFFDDEPTTDADRAASETAIQRAIDVAREHKRATVAVFKEPRDPLLARFCRLNAVGVVGESNPDDETKPLPGMGAGALG